MNLEPWVTSLLLTLAAIATNRVLDWQIGRRKQRRAAQERSQMPTFQTGWQGAYDELREKYLKLEDRMDGLQAEFDALTAAVKEEPFAVAQRILARAKVTV